MIPTNHPLWFLSRESPGFIPSTLHHSLLSTSKFYHLVQPAAHVFLAPILGGAARDAGTVQAGALDDWPTPPKCALGPRFGGEKRMDFVCCLSDPCHPNKGKGTDETRPRLFLHCRSILRSFLELCSEYFLWQMQVEVIKPTRTSLAPSSQNNSQHNYRWKNEGWGNHCDTSEPPQPCCK